MTDSDTDKSQPNYEYILSLDSLNILQISRIADGDDLTFNLLDGLIPNFNTSKAHIYLTSAIAAEKIKSANQDGRIFVASPRECFQYLQNKGFKLPELLAQLLPSSKRSKESYLPENVRGDEKALKAVFQTLLDLWPELPKEKIIELKPVQSYANGRAHSADALKKMITDIEGKNRSGGAPNKELLAEIQKEIPLNWLP